MSPETSEPLLHSRASFPFPVMVSLALNLMTDNVLTTMPSSVLLLMVLPPRLVSDELWSTRTPVPVLVEISRPPSREASECSTISIPPLPLLLIWILPANSQWLVPPQWTPRPVLLLMVPSLISTLLLLSTNNPHEPPLLVIRLSELISPSALLATSTPPVPLLLIPFSVPGVPSPPFMFRCAVRAAIPNRPLPVMVTPPSTLN